MKWYGYAVSASSVGGPLGREGNAWPGRSLSEDQVSEGASEEELNSCMVVIFSSCDVN
jgi:hypothetical protein